MKIVHTEASWGWGGQEIRILTEGAELIKRGHEVTLVADPCSTIAKRAADYGVPLVPTTLRAKRLPDLMSLRAVLKTLKPDLVVCHSSTDHWLTALARLTLGGRFAIVRARHISAAINQAITTRWLYTKGCDAITTTAETIAAQIKLTFPKHQLRIFNIPTGIDWSTPSQAERVEARRGILHELKIDEPRVLISIVATLRSWKGHSYLIEAIDILIREQSMRGITVLIIGDGPQDDALKAQVNDLNLSKVFHFLGQRQDVRTLLMGSDIFCLPSYANEGVPQAILQAMSVGLRIASTNLPGIVEATKSYSKIIHVESRDSKKLATALATQIDQISAGENALPQTPFTLAGMIRECETVYRSVIV